MNPRTEYLKQVEQGIAARDALLHPAVASAFAEAEATLIAKIRAASSEQEVLEAWRALRGIDAGRAVLESRTESIDYAKNRLESLTS